ncbi:MAG: lasso RiPP family leader peptide-containing protein [Candidatus Acidiferrales bacterium]
MTPSSEPRTTLKPYKTPELTVYGPIRELTLTGGTSSTSDHHNKTTIFFT